MSEIVEKVVARLIDRHSTITFAETCTGGLMASELISVPGASKVFNASVIVYSNESKIRYTGISDHILIHYGAVSEEAVKAMAKGIAIQNKANIGVAISGITGPQGGTPDKPVGMV
ncbi:MAG: CinA family protein, partial [Erysipelotrichaceae bacterium]|nr:CinA family protein [Erysipelotrichaceae bacterium]